MTYEESNGRVTPIRLESAQYLETGCSCYLETIAN